MRNRRPKIRKVHIKHELVFVLFALFLITQIYAYPLVTAPIETKTFGNTGIETNQYIRGYHKLAYRAYLSENGTAESVTVYFDSAQSESDDISAGLYRGDQTDPPYYPPIGLVVCSPSRKVVAGAWNDFVFTTPVVLNASYYWIFVISSTALLYLRYIDEGGVSPIVFQTDPPPPSDPFGSPEGWATTRFSIYCTYIIGEEEPTAVQEAVGIATPYAYSAIAIWSLSLIVAVGAGLIVSWQTQEFTLGMVTTVIVCVGILVALFIALPLLNAFSAL